MFSTPAYLGQRLAGAAGSIQLTLPASLPAGAHRLAVLDANGTVIGWFALAASAAALAATGADAVDGLAFALLLVGVGGVLVATRLVRHGAATRQARARPEQGHLRQAATTPPTLSHRPKTRHQALD